jgi:hypothetical protein
LPYEPLDGPPTHTASVIHNTGHVRRSTSAGGFFHGSWETFSHVVICGHMTKHGR